MLALTIIGWAIAFWLACGLATIGLSLKINRWKGDTLCTKGDFFLPATLGPILLVFLVIYLIDTKHSWF